MLAVHNKALREAQEALDDARSWGTLDFGSICELVLEMEDSPEKARALARLAGFALWYADWLRREERSP